MRFKAIITVISVVAALTFTCVVLAEDEAKVTPGDIIIMVNKAAKYLEESGEAGLADFNDPKGPWVWSGTYVFVFNCEKGVIAAHPNKDLIGVELASRKDEKGVQYNLLLCDEAKNPTGGWVEYWRPTDVMDEEGNAKFRRKISYIMQVPGLPYQVGAGIYEPTMTVEELNNKIDEVMKKVKEEVKEEK